MESKVKIILPPGNKSYHAVVADGGRAAVGRATGSRDGATAITATLTARFETAHIIILITRLPVGASGRSCANPIGEEHGAPSNQSGRVRWASWKPRVPAAAQSMVCSFTKYERRSKRNTWVTPPSTDHEGLTEHHTQWYQQLYIASTTQLALRRDTMTLSIPLVRCLTDGSSCSN